MKDERKGGREGRGRRWVGRGGGGGGGGGGVERVIRLIIPAVTLAAAVALLDKSAASSPVTCSKKIHTRLGGSKTLYSQSISQLLPARPVRTHL